jgi:5'-phosphate synthase pdxT subunit
MRVGILALQGNFARHRLRLQEFGVQSLLVKKAGELSAVDSLIIPGGESTTLLKLADPALRTEIVHCLKGGLPTLATCAGLILLAKHVSQPEQESLGVLDIDVLRNAYGRQIDSFIDPTVEWTDVGYELASRLPADKHNCQNNRRTFEGIFIRAPRISRIGANIQVLASRNGDPVLVKEGCVFGACFHPELSPSAHAVHRLFLEAVRSALRMPGGFLDR